MLPHPLLLPPQAPDAVLQAGLAELFQLGLTVARVSARLAEAEGWALEAWAETAAATTRGVMTEASSMQGAAYAGRQADVSDTARAAIAARINSATASFDQAARAVRRTAALQARLAEGRSVRTQEPGRERPPTPGATARHAANDAERADQADDPEWGDDIAGRSDEEVVGDIHRDLDAASARLSPSEPAALPAPARTAGAPPAKRPRIVRIVPEAEPEPDT